MIALRAPLIYRARGFTLIELAVVLFIIALILGGLMAPLAVRLEQNERNDTEQRLGEIKESLYGFAITNGRLPCPDCSDAAIGNCGAVPAANRNDGIEDRIGTPLSCAATAGGFSVGNIPWTDLGVQQFDAWQRHFAYGVTTSFADATNGAGGCSGTPTVGVSFELCSTANGTILDAAGGANLVTGTPAIVISYGSNGNVMPPASTHEQENADGDAIAVLKPFSREPTEEFDDLLIWVAPNVLMNRMVMAGRLP